MTYPNSHVQQALSQHFLPCKVESAKDPELARRLGIRWMPGLAVLDAADRPVTTQIGFLPPEDLLTELDFARAIVAMGEKRYDEAHALFEKVTAQREAERAPEAAYWWGVSRQRQLKDFAAAVKEPWTMVLERWPKSQWARKVAYARKYLTP